MARINLKENAKPIDTSFSEAKAYAIRENSEMNLSKFINKSAVSHSPTSAMSTLRLIEPQPPIDNPNAESVNFVEYKAHSETLINCLKKQLQDKEDQTNELLQKLNMVSAEVILKSAAIS